MSLSKNKSLSLWKNPSNFLRKKSLLLMIRSLLLKPKKFKR